MSRVDSGIKVFSFDVDGTLVSQEFANSVWLRGIPEAYATKHELSFEDAFEFIKREYDTIGDNRIEWYNIRFWLRKFNLKISYETLFEKYKAEVKSKMSRLWRWRVQEYSEDYESFMRKMLDNSDEIIDFIRKL